MYKVRSLISLKRKVGSDVLTTPSLSSKGSSPHWGLVS